MNKVYNLLLIFLFSIFCLSVRAQKEGNNWYFGNNAGLTFNTSPPTALTNGALNTLEGSATISDCSGSLLFYTDGVTIWDKTHNPMPNGTGLLGHPSSTQSGIMVPQPDNDSIYYVFTLEAQEQASHRLHYSIVNMNLLGGLGNVTVKNVLLLPYTTERITVVRHTNNIDFWIVVHLGNSIAFNSYLLSSSGLNTSPITSNVGVAQAGPNTAGYMKSSPDGSKICEVQYTLNSVQVFDFNRATGVLANAFAFNKSTYPYGVEFSPDGLKLYLTCVGSGTIIQYDLSLGTAAAIIASATLIGSPASAPCIFSLVGGALQLGPDGKIYVGRCGTSTLGVIDNPNFAGIGCNYIDIGVSLGGKLVQLGLTNLISAFFNQPIITASNFCSGDTTFFGISDVGKIDSVKWNFGNPASGTKDTSTIFSYGHIYDSPGTYNVTAIVYRPCPDTLEKAVTIHGVIVNIGNDTIICQGITTGAVTLDAENPGNTFLWSTAAIGNTIAVTFPATYWVKVTDTSGCVGSDTLEIIPAPQANASISGDTTICTGDSTLLFVISAGTFLWNTGSVNDSITVTPSSKASYSLLIVNQYGCSSTDSINVFVDPPINLATIAVNVTCIGACDGKNIVTSNGGTAPYLYNWTGGCTNDTCNNLCPGYFTVTVTDAFGCSVTIDTSITEPAVLAAAILNSVNASCHNACDGSATCSASGGTSGAGYSYSWNITQVQTNAIATGLCAGSYSCTVTDANNCSAITTVTISEPPLVVISPITNLIICPGSNATLAASASGGNPGGYNYSWDAPGNSGFANTALVTVSPAGTTTFTVNATDSIHNCPAAPVTVSVSISLFLTLYQSEIIFSLILDI